MRTEAAITCRVPSLEGNYGLSFTLNASNLKHAVSFIPSESFTLAKVAFRVAAKTGTPTCTVRIETDSAGRPSGTLAWTSSEATGQAVPAAGAWSSELSLGASGTVSPGTMYHFVVINDHGTPASNNFAVSDTNAKDYLGYNGLSDLTAYTASYDGTSWSTRIGGVFMLADSGGTTRFGQPFEAGSIQTLNSTTAYGVKFTAQLGGTVSAVQFSHLPNSPAGTVTANLYDNSDTLLGTATLPSGVQSLAVRRTDFAYFDTPPTIAAGSIYRLVFNDTQSADRLEYVTTPSSPTDYRQINPVMQYTQWTQGTTGSWTDTLGKLPVGFAILMATVTSGGGGGISVGKYVLAAAGGSPA